MIRYEHREEAQGPGSRWLSCVDADELAHRLFMLGGQGRAILATRAGEYIMAGRE